MSALLIRPPEPPPAKPARVELPGRLAFSEVANDVLEVLAGRTDFLTTLELHRALDCRRQYHGLSTLKHALTRLVKAGVLSVRHKKPYGYRLTRKWSVQAPAP